MPIHVVALFVASMPLHAVAFLAVHRLPSEIFNASFTGESQALHVKPHLNNTGSSFGAEPISWGPGPRSILIRYAIFDAPPSVGFHYFGIPALLASMCQIETGWLQQPWHTRFLDNFQAIWFTQTTAVMHQSENS